MSVVALAEHYWAIVEPRLDIFGALGLFLGFAAGAMPRRSWMLLASAACAACFGLHYVHLGALTAAAMCAISILQNLVAAHAIGPERRATWVGPLFAASTLIAGGLTLTTWNGWPSTCAGIGALLATTARLQPDPHKMRRLFLCASLCWAAHNFLVSSIFGLTCDLLTLLGLVIALHRSERHQAALA